MKTVFVSGNIIETEEEVVTHRLVIPRACELFNHPEHFIVPVDTDTRFNRESGMLEVRAIDIKEGDLKFPDPRSPLIWVSYGVDEFGRRYLELMWTSLASDNPNTADIERVVSQWTNLTWVYYTQAGEYREMLNGTMPAEDVARVEKIDFDDFDNPTFVITVGGIKQQY